jgi:hypothetical protein
MKAGQAIREDRERSEPQAIDCKIPSKGCGRTHSVLRNTASPQDVRERETSDSDDNLGTDFAKAALSTGSQAFESSDWDEANSLFQEALRILERLPKRQRTFCDGFSGFKSSDERFSYLHWIKRNGDLRMMEAEQRATL